MKSKSIKLVIIIVLAVLFIPLFSISVGAVNDDEINNKIKEFVDVYVPLQLQGQQYIIKQIDFKYSDGSGGTQLVAVPLDVQYDTTGSRILQTLPSGGKWSHFQYDYNSGYIGSFNTTNQTPAALGSTFWYTITNYVKKIEFEELTTMPIRELPYYIFYEDGDHNHWFQEFNQTPVFTLRGSKYADYTNMEFEMDWQGIGGAKTYKYNTDNNTWDFYFTDSNLYLSVPYGNYWFKIHRANFELNIDNNLVEAPIYEYWDTQDPTVNNTLKLISPAQPIKTIHDKLRVKLKYSSIHEYPLESSDISIIPGVDLDFIDTEWKQTNRWIGKPNRFEYTTEKIVTMDIYLNDPVLIWNDNKTTVQFIAKVATKKDRFGNVAIPGHQNRIYVEIEKTEMVDLDGDGYDDNTGETGNWESDTGIDIENQEPSRSQYPVGIVGEIEFLGDMLLYWVKTPFNMFKSGLQYIVKLVDETFSWTNKYATFVSRMFSFLPAPILDLLGLMFSVIIITTLIKVVRG